MYAVFNNLGGNIMFRGHGDLRETKYQNKMMIQTIEHNQWETSLTIQRLVHFKSKWTELSYLPSHYITVTQFQYIWTISIAWEFATN